MFRNFRQLDYLVFGRGSLKQLSDIIRPHRKPGRPMVFIIDHFFEGKTLPGSLGQENDDVLIFADVTDEPKTSYIDTIADTLKSECGSVSGIIGIGGGSTMDIAKAVSLMMGNPGKAHEYQGWDLVKNPGVYKVGIPTISGTGAEVSRTCVLTGPTRKLGMNSDFTPFNQIVLDPELIHNVPANQRFYTGMDCYIHCIESLQGTFINTFSRAVGEKSLELCQEVFLHKKQWDAESDDKLIMASYLGGMSIAYSQVGVAHAVSYGLGFLLGTKHGIGNCIVFDKLQDYYPEAVKEFKQMVKQNNIEIPQGICKGLSEDEYNTMIDVSLGMVPLWENALGKDWKTKITREKLRTLYEQF